MPEGHSVHRVALQLGADLVGHRLRVSSPQGRFAAGAELLDGRVLERSDAVGKHLFLTFAGALVLHVHLGLYGSWDLAGTVSPLPGGTQRVRSTSPRRRVRMAEGEDEREGAVAAFPPPPVGQVRVRLLAPGTVADLRGPTACEVLREDEVLAVLARLGPDPVEDGALSRHLGGAPAPGGAAQERVVHAVTRRAVPVGRLLMDQSVVAGIGNIYRAELLFRARLDPWVPGRAVPPELVAGLWQDWSGLLRDGIREGVMVTREDLDPAGRRHALRHRDARHWVYRRTGEPCRVCGTPVLLETMEARKLYRCPVCQRRP
ncbi:Fpg/Nei family DNA glycosylase [Cellulomonas endophytica]|uniref:Fpg/Nei family DNA glycosylase n=1 Tax=Cellulomonas endophytica TaxID=2494735 RepID=UPI00101094F8|nr:DNA-formamidopyrimidine glycosylase family protein [Cellulomonas endophytica]